MVGDELLERDTPDEGAMNAAAASIDPREWRSRDRGRESTPAIGARLRAPSGIAPARPPQLGELLDGRYELGALIGRGAMGWVVGGCDHRVSRVVAVKVMRPELAADAALAWRFEQEAIAAGRLNCPHVVTVHDFGSVDGTPYLVMERLFGQSLALRLRSSPDGLPLPEAIAIARDMATALASAEAVGVVHRDLKPGNVFLTDAGGAKLLDFGVAKITAASRLSVGPSPTSTGMLIGTPTYMSPEAVSERGEVTTASDVYALGALLFSMIAGEAPFTATEPIVVLHMHLTRPAPRLSAQRPDLRIPPALDELIARCLAKEPSARPSAQALVAALGASRCCRPSARATRARTSTSSRRWRSSSSCRGSRRCSSAPPRPISTSSRGRGRSSRRRRPRSRRPRPRSRRRRPRSRPRRRSRAARVRRGSWLAARSRSAPRSSGSSRSSRACSGARARAPPARRRRSARPPRAARAPPPPARRARPER